MKTVFILFLFVPVLLFSLNRSLEHYPVTYAQLGTPLFQQVDNFKSLSETRLLLNQDKDFRDYMQQAKTAIKHGYETDASDPTDSQKIKVYLLELRALQKLHDKIEKSYKKQLYKSIEENDQSTFYNLTSVSLPFVSTDPRLKEKVVDYYKKTQLAYKSLLPIDDQDLLVKKQTISYLDDLYQDFGLDKKSYAYVHAMFQTSKKDQRTEERTFLEEFVPDLRKNTLVQVVSIKTKNGFDLYLENNAYYDVSIELKAVKLINLISSERLPFIGSFSAQSRTKILNLSIRDPYKESLFQTLYSTTIGRINPNYNSNYLYSLPYARGEAYLLTQGFNGEYTHKGSSAYALDFKMDEGTKVYAMREGTVVSIEDRHNQHGFSPEFSDKSNYIIIQHDDGTMAMYGHLKQYGVKVKLGQKVYNHSYIGLSGNTGYSSGPHLHVHISAMKSLVSGPSSIPFSFLAQIGKVDYPQVNSFYIAK